MIDIHNHLLPFVDDGPKEMEDALAMARQAVEQGVTQVVATPHYKTDEYENLRVLESLQSLRGELKKNKIPLEIFLGNEIYADQNALASILSGKALPMGRTQYLLLELPVMKMYPFHHEMIFQLQKKGYQIILAHVDRYTYFKEDPEKLKYLIERGCFAQVNASALLKREKSIGKWIEKGWIHFIASDSHDIHRRPNQMKAVRHYLMKYYNQATADALTKLNAQCMLKNEPLLPMSGVRSKRFWLSAVFNLLN